MRSPRNSIEPLVTSPRSAAQQVADGAQGGRLARAVAAEQRDDLAFGHLQRHALQHQDDVVVDDLDAVDIEHGCARAHGRASSLHARCSALAVVGCSPRLQASSRGVLVGGGLHHRLDDRSSAWQPVGREGSTSCRPRCGCAPNRAPMVVGAGGPIGRITPAKPSASSFFCVEGRGSRGPSGPARRSSPCPCRNRSCARSDRLRRRASPPSSRAYVEHLADSLPSARYPGPSRAPASITSFA